MEHICKCNKCRELIEASKSIDEAFMVYGESYPVTFIRKGTIVELDYPTTAAKKAATYHYIFNKSNEISDIKSKDIRQLLDNLVDTFNKIEPTSGERLVSHLLKWKNTLENY